MNGLSEEITLTIELRIKIILILSAISKFSF